MDTEQLKEMQVKFRQGLEKLDLLGKCLAMVGQAQQLELHLLGLTAWQQLRLQETKAARATVTISPNRLTWMNARR